MRDLEQMRIAYWNLRKKWKETQKELDDAREHIDKLHVIKEKQRTELDKLQHAIVTAEQILYTAIMEEKPKPKPIPIGQWWEDINHDEGVHLYTCHEDGSFTKGGTK